MDFDDQICPLTGQVKATPAWLRYAIYQEEVGENGTHHFQGYLELSSPQRIAALKRAFPEFERAHFEVARGSQEQCIAYCSKEDTRIDGPYEWGEKSAGQGNREDIKAFVSSIKEGATDLSLLDAYPNAFLRNYKMIPVVRSLVAKPRTTMPKVYVLWGPTNLGKSHWVREKAPQAYWKARSNGNNNWFDGYTPGQDLVLDDFYGWIPWDLMLRICDQFNLIVECKGGSVMMSALRIFITSNAHPRSWYKNEKIQHDFETFARRVYSWMEWTGFKTYRKSKDPPPLIS